MVTSMRVDPPCNGSTKAKGTAFASHRHDARVPKSEIAGPERLWCIRRSTLEKGLIANRLRPSLVIERSRDRVVVAARVVFATQVA
jgi:hypothetical protein